MFNNIFSIFLYEKKFNFNLNSMKKIILKNKKVNKGVEVSNCNGWQSNGSATILPEFKNLFNNIDQCVGDILNKLQYEKKLKLANYWFNVNGLGSFNRPHSHVGVISGVFYIAVPKNSGKIVFMNPVNLDGYFSEVKNFNEYTSSTWNYSPKENHCLLFPSHLKHYVESNMNKQERISLSFNYVI
tara:strand:- start:233 stop:787 length:555 start_codon:yes stop_codon:yes gene_type:complete